MARIFFVGLDGTEKSYRLQTHRPFTVGRDPGNDIILRDPKVSRHHAEIVFERGFFVLHDLASANGTYINGKRIRVAPLTHGAKLRMGNSYGRFSEELPTEADAAPSAQVLETPIPQQPTVALDSGEIDDVATDENSRISMETLPHEKLGEDELKKKVD